MTQNIIFLYRDADNYKFHFTASVETSQELKAEDTLNYTDLGITQDQFHSDIVKYPYNEQSDHELIDVVEVMPENAEVEFNLTLRDGAKTTEAEHL